MNWKTKMGLALAPLAIGGMLFIPSVSRADETTGEKIENTVDDAKKDIKKSARKGKRKIRNATGNGSVTDDIKDAGKDVGDEVETGAKKLKRKVD